MKILAIRLKNLASLAGPFDLDFSAEPLASAGLFAITGPTGAGKSTLLDALCLALFGTVPRLNNIGRETKVPEIDADIGTYDPRTLLRRGTGSGYAEVDFVGLDGRRYRARWEANRARDKANGKLQGSRQSLHDLDSNQLLSNQSKSEYKSLIEARLGLNFDQFTRAVMLAQSEFSAFLKADDKERSELLEKLTNTTIYSQLGRRAYSKSKEAQESCKALNNQAEGTAPLGAEARAELDQRFNDAQRQWQTQQAQHKQLELQHRWLIDLHQLQDAQQSAAEQLQEAQQHWDSQSVERLNLGWLEQLVPQRHQFVRSAELDTQRSPLAAQIQQSIQQQSELHARQAQLEHNQLAARTALMAAQSRQSDSAPLLRQAFEEQSTLARLSKELSQGAELKQQAERACAEGQGTLHALSSQQHQVAERLERIAAQLQQSAMLAPLAEAWSAYRPRLQQSVQLSNRLAQGREELPALQRRAAQAEQQLAEQRSALEILYREADAEPSAVSEQIQTLGSLLQDSRQQQRSLEDLGRLWNSRQELDTRLLELQQKQQQAQEQREQLIAAGMQSKEALTLAEQTLTVTRQLLERQRLARSASVEELRGLLQDEQPCPVCGSLEHPYHQPEILLQSLTRHDEREEANARQRVDDLKEKLAQLREKVGGLIAQQKEFLQQQERLATEQQALTPSLAAHPLYPQLLDQDAEQRNVWLSRRLGQLSQSIQQDEQRQGALLTLQKDAARLQHQLQAAIDACQATTQQLNEQQRHLASDGQRLEEELASFASLLPDDTLQALQNNAAQTFMQLDQQVIQRLGELEQQHEEQQEQRERQLKIEQEQFQQQTRVQQQEVLQQRFAGLCDQQQGCQQKLGEWLGEHSSAEHWQQQLEQAVEHARAAETLATQALQEIHQQLIQLGAELKARQERLHAIERESLELNGKIAEWRSRHIELDDSRLEQLLAFDDAHISQLRQQIQDSEKAIEQAKVLFHEREHHLQKHQAQHNGNLQPEQLATELNELQGLLSISEQQCAELRALQADDQRRQNTHQQLQQQIASAYAEYQRWARLATLIGSAEGDKFRKIAQAYNLDLLVHHANAQLRQLARRYRLKRGGSMLGLLVLDTEMGDELRSVHSLSGGETFLVSLALALGLASMASSTLKIESLFIDEGFGSLDPESLQLAMDALDGLQAQGRKVAVISHVQEMHERIAVQIQVRRQGNGLSTIEVSG